MDPRSERVAEMFASLPDRDRVDRILDDLYDPDCVFADPLQTAEGIDAIRAMNRRLEKKLGDVEVEILGDAVSDATLVMRWVMTFKAPFMPGRASLEGVSWMEEGADGKFVRHTDYWDLATLIDDVAPVAKPVHDMVRRLAG